jgi:hypothetical protein
MAAWQHGSMTAWQRSMALQHGSSHGGEVGPEDKTINSTEGLPGSPWMFLDLAGDAGGGSGRGTWMCRCLLTGPTSSNSNSNIDFAGKHRHLLVIVPPPRSKQSASKKCEEQ